MRTRLVARLAIALGLAASAASAAERPRARDLGVPFDGTPGPLNAITDVAGVEVGQVTLISGEGKLEVGRGPVRTGVTAILPARKGAERPRASPATFALNGNGEMTGTRLARGVGLPRGAGGHHQHPQRGRSCATR